MIRRREFIAGLGSAAAMPLAARAQQAPLPVIGFLSAQSADDEYKIRVVPFLQGLKEAGYVVGQNVAVEYRWAENQYDRLPALAADLVRGRVSVIIVSGDLAVLAARAATTTIPIVFNVGSNPVEAGHVASLARPGANLTGVTTLNLELGPKRLELLHELVPTATDIGLLVNPTNRVDAEPQSRGAQAAARTLGLRLHILHASTEHDFDTIFASLVQLRAGGLVISGDAFFTSRYEQLAALAIRHVMPTIGAQYREFAAAGGLMSYGAIVTDAGRLAGTYAGRILKGEKPSDLPVQQSTKIEMVLNLKTAKALGLTVPQSILLSADEVIE